MIVKTTINFLKKSAIILAAFIIIYSLCSFVLPRITIDKEKNESEEVTIFIKTNGVHTDIVMPVKNEIIDWSKKIRFENTILKDSTAKFVALGWGDKGFYLETPEWSDLKASVAFKAATGLGNTAIHTTFYSKMTVSESCKKIHISKEQYKRLIVFVEKSFKRNKTNNYIPIVTNANYGQNDSFYEAEGSYSVFQTCNTWANNGLKSCGQKCCFWTPFDTGIFLKYNNQ